MWPLKGNRPVIEVQLQLSSGGSTSRTLLADTGAGSLVSGFELVLSDADCALASSTTAYSVVLGGAYRGTFPVCWVRIGIAALGFDRRVRAASVSTLPPGLDGIAGFRFLSRFSNGNLRSQGQFGLEIV
jgi:hypothetical protein